MDDQQDGFGTVLGGLTVVVLVITLLVHGTIGWDDVSAAWVQAWGSLLGLAIAIGVPWWMQLREQRRRRGEEQARAVVVALGLYLDVEAMLDYLTDFYTALKAEAERTMPINLRVLAQGLAALPVPTDAAVSAIQPADSVAAYALARGCTRFRQLAQTVNLFRDVPFDANVRTAVLSLSKHIDPAMTDLIEGHRRLKALCAAIPEFALPEAPRSR